MKTKQLTAIEAAHILGLSENDPTVALYQGIEYFESNQPQQALLNFIIAASQFQLHAIPYIQEITKSKSVVIDAPSREKLAVINQWADWLTDMRIDHKEFLLASKRMIKIQSIVKKDAKSLKEKAKLNKEFTKDSTLCGHLKYHQGNLTSAANNGHLLAVAHFAQGGKLDENQTAYAREFCSVAYHQQPNEMSYAERLYQMTLTNKDLVGKTSFQYESVRLGAKQAFGSIAQLYFVAKKDAKAALPLVAIGVLRQDPHARYILGKVLELDHRCVLKGFDTTPLQVVNLLRQNLQSDYHLLAHPMYNHEYIANNIKENSIIVLCLLIKKFHIDAKICKDNGLISLLVALFETELNLPQDVKIMLEGCISTIYMRIAAAEISPHDQILNKQHALKLLYSLYNKTHDFDYLLVIIYVLKEIYEIKSTNDLINIDDKLIALMELHRHITDLESITTEKIPFKMIEYCVYIYQKLIKRLPKKQYESQLQRYLHLAVKSKDPKYMCVLAIYYANGRAGFEQDFVKAREIILSLPAGYQLRRGLILVLATSYLHDVIPNTKKALEIILSYAITDPVLYVCLGDYYSDGYLGIEIDVNIAKAYYQKAIDRNVIKGYVGLGVNKFDDYNAAQDPQVKADIKLSALSDLHKAHEAKISDAAYFLGKIYLDGYMGVEPNFELAKKYFEEATKLGQPFAKSVMAMIDAGYSGEYPHSLEYEIIKQESLKKSGYIDFQAPAMFEYGVVSLLTDPVVGCKYLCKAARYNDNDAQYLLAILQFLNDYKFCTFINTVIAKINKKDYRQLIAGDPPACLVPCILSLFQFSKLVSYYMQKQYTIEPSYVFDNLMLTFQGVEMDLAEIENQIKEYYAPEEIMKTRLLVQKQAVHSKSGDKECRQATDALLCDKSSPQKNLQKKIIDLSKRDKISMKCFRDCLTSFFKSGATVSEANKSAVKAGEHIHPPHGFDHNPNQNLERGRRETVRSTLQALASDLEIMSHNK